MAGSVFDPSTGRWYPVPSGGSGNSGGSGGGSGGGSRGNRGGNRGRNNSRNRNTAKYKKVKINLLAGDLSLNPTRRNLSLSLGATVGLKGFGKYLSGGYFVVGRTITLDESEGLTFSVSVVRPKFLDTVKGMSKYDD